jgi:hypothetical protein
LDRGKHELSFSFAIRDEFRQVDVVQFASGAAINGRTLQTFILQKNVTILEEKVQLALAILIQTFGNDRHVIFAPLGILIQLTSVAGGVVQFEIHGDLAIGSFSDFDRVVTRRRLTVYSEHTLVRTHGRLAY